MKATALKPAQRHLIVIAHAGFVKELNAPGTIAQVPGACLTYLTY